jgi:DHA1 family tetracycline resistance protein-like MFS transporter
MVAQSKHEDTQRTLRWAAVTLATFAFGIAMVVPTRASLLLSAVNGDAQMAGSIMARNTSIGAALEFLLNPIVGQLSDSYGRKPFLMLSCLVTALMHGR